MRSKVLVPLRELRDPIGHLICLHHAGGGPTAFREWPGLIRSDISIAATNLPGRAQRYGQTMHRSLEDAAGEVADALRESWPVGGPVVLFGHSLGGLMAFEVARLLEAQQLSLSRVVISGVAPIRPEAHRYEWSDEQLCEMLREMGGTPEEVFEHKDLLALCVGILRADLRLVDTYNPTGVDPIRAPITVMGGVDDKNVQRGALEHWGKYTDGGSHVEMFPGGHFYLDDEQEAVTDWLGGHLDVTETFPLARTA